jgi:hypothetical protein
MEHYTLARELKDDPLNRGYATMTNAEIMVSLRTPNRTRLVTSIPSSTVIEATVMSEYAGLSASQRDIYWGMLAGGEIKPSGLRTKTIYAGLFGPSSSTRANLIALATDTISRMEELGISENALGYLAKAREIGKLI